MSALNHPEPPDDSLSAALASARATLKHEMELLRIAQSNLRNTENSAIYSSRHDLPTSTPSISTSSERNQAMPEPTRNRREPAAQVSMQTDADVAKSDVVSTISGPSASPSLASIDEFDSPATWLEQNGMQQYTPRFLAERITTGQLMALTDDNLIRLGLSSLGDRLRFREALQAFPPTIEVSPRRLTPANDEQNTNEEQPRRLFPWRAPGFWTILLALWVIGTIHKALECGPAMQSESSNNAILQNGDIPGYAACVDKMAVTCPHCPIRMCCDQVGGTYFQRGAFPTCELAQ